MTYSNNRTTGQPDNRTTNYQLPITDVQNPPLIRVFGIGA